MLSLLEINAALLTTVYTLIPSSFEKRRARVRQFCFEPLCVRGDGTRSGWAPREPLAVNRLREAAARIKDAGGGRPLMVFAITDVCTNESRRPVSSLLRIVHQDLALTTSHGR